MRTFVKLATLKTYYLIKGFNAGSLKADRLKGLDAVDFASVETLNKWADQIETWPTAQHEIGNQAIEDIMSGVGEYIGVVDDKNGKLLGVVNYMIIRQAHEVVPVATDDFIYVAWIASIEKGVGTLMMKDILQISEAMQSPVVLEAASGSSDFYEKMGMEWSELSGGAGSDFYYYIPKQLKKQLDTNKNPKLDPFNLNKQYEH